MKSIAEFHIQVHEAREFEYKKLFNKSLKNRRRIGLNQCHLFCSSRTYWQLNICRKNRVNNSVLFYIVRIFIFV